MMADEAAVRSVAAILGGNQHPPYADFYPTFQQLMGRGARIGREQKHAPHEGAHRRQQAAAHFSLSIMRVRSTCDNDPRSLYPEQAIVSHRFGSRRVGAGRAQIGQWVWRGQGDPAMHA
eukprot:jgi/Mesvir1/15383/Mv26329-RA.1